ncbi:hypothetical protein M758_4G274800 [Ceratodon purpureus]|nr:hypothetical protein M758_4G274800 [Ceratodon purpureus]
MNRCQSHTHDHRNVFIHEFMTLWSTSITRCTTVSLDTVLCGNKQRFRPKVNCSSLNKLAQSLQSMYMMCVLIDYIEEIHIQVHKVEPLTQVRNSIGIGLTLMANQ